MLTLCLEQLLYYLLSLWIGVSPGRYISSSVLNLLFILKSFFLKFGSFMQAAKTLLDEKLKDASASSNIGFYESKREWLGRRHYLLAFEGY